MAALALDAVRALPVFLGKTQCRVDDFFEVEGEASDELEIRGDAAKVKWIGRGMTRGRITHRRQRRHAPRGLHEGRARSKSPATSSDWVGAEMSGGLIRIRGNAGGQIGAAYRGSLSGMKGGTILIDGSAGLEVGMRMKRGSSSSAARCATSPACR